MAVEAPLSKFKRNTLIIWMIVCIAAAIYCTYDGYFNENFKNKHLDADGKPDSTLVFNQKSPAYFVGAAVLFGGYLFAIRNRKVIADENELIIGKQTIAYDSIEKIDKTHFNSKGFFIITYKDSEGKETNYKISDKTYDNLAMVLDELVAKIT